ncbi:Thermoresistant gluconokinase [Clavibacter michiganensis]|uniref:Gluconokinase n=1 Tax=Clavibacter michiganensis TaxID=28447 RepID=A0A251YV54_9MICO|nr:gluconokinase [Clavibacter michiganensis]OUE28127.1 Thermoresistant gluconokinase [Clavibacter michiganensis]
MTGRAAARARGIVVMGVSGCGKSTVGARLADALGGRFVDADDLHPPANVAKMAMGVPLDDADRRPWLARVAEALAEDARADGAPRPTVVACSALRRRYRDALRDGSGARLDFVHLVGDPALLERRITARTGHFMPPGLLLSQLAVLEDLDPDERGVLVDIAPPPGSVVRAALDGLAALPHREDPSRA